MKSASFPQQNIIMGKDQPEYLPLPAHRSQEGVVTSFWKFTPEELDRFREQDDGKNEPGIFISQLTFGGKLQPVVASLDFNPPKVIVVKDEMPDEIPPTEPVNARGDPVLPRVSRFANIAHVRGLSGPLLFAMDGDTLKEDGLTICHFVRLETVAFKEGDDAGELELKKMDAEAEPRLVHLADCFTGPMAGAHIQLLQTIGLCREGLKAALVNIPDLRVRQGLSNLIQLATKALDTHG